MSKIRKIMGGGRKLLVLATSMLLILSFCFTSFAANTGDKVTYTAKHVDKTTSDWSGTAVFSATIDGMKLTGTCAELGTPLAASGTGKIEKKFSNNSKVAKVMYRLVYQKDFFTNPTRSESLHGVISGIPSSTVWTKGFFVESVAQIGGMGKSAWLKEWGGESSTAIRVGEWYDNYDASFINVPDNFELYLIDAGNDQDFVAWRLKPEEKNAKCKIKKASANPSITG